MSRESEHALELLSSVEPEKWKAKRTVFEYDPVEFKIIDTQPHLDNADSIDGQLYRVLSYAMETIRQNKSGYIKNSQRSYYYAGDESTDTSDSVLIGKIEDKICLVGDEESEIIISPLFDKLLAVTPTYIDIELMGVRLRLSSGSYEMSDARPNSRRHDDMDDAEDIPDCFEENQSIKISLLEPLSAADLEEYYFAAQGDILDTSHKLFDEVQQKIITHITSNTPSHELAERLQDVDQALHMPAVNIDNQSYTLTLRTSQSADVIFLHNSSIQTDQDRLADSMLKLSIPEFLELAYDESLQHSLLYETLAERGFHFVRQHDGQLFIMDRDMQRASIVTPKTAYYSTVLRQVQQQLSVYFKALNEQRPAGQSLRSIRIAAGLAIAEEAKKTELRQRSFARKALDWFMAH